MTATATNKKPGLNLGKLSAVAQIAVKPVQPADAEIDLERLYSVKQVRKTFRNLEELAESFAVSRTVTTDDRSGDIRTTFAARANRIDA